MKKRLFSLLSAAALALTLVPAPSRGAEAPLPLLPHEPGPVVLEKEAPDAPQALPLAEADYAPCAAALPGDAAARALGEESPVALFSARSDVRTVTVELSTDGKAVGKVVFALDGGSRTAALVQADPEQGVEGMVVIPRTLTHEEAEYTVTAIGPAAFAGQTGLTQLWLPDTVSEIGYEAFMDCDHLKAVGTYDEEGAADPYALPEGVDYIGDRTFRGCTRLSSVIIPAAVTRISAWAFAYCYSLGSGVRDSAGVTYGVYFAPGSRLNTIDQGAFFHCISLENITLPQGLESIGLQAFSHCASQEANGTLHGLKTLVIPDTVTELGEEAFSYCGALRQVTIPGGIQTLPSKAFYACSAMETVDFTGDGLTAMGHSAFFWCTKLKTIRTAGAPGLPATLKAIPRWAFYRCDSLAQVDLSGVSALREIEAYAFNESGVVELKLSQDLKYIRLLAFEGCQKLKTIHWNRPEQDDDLLEVGEKAFANTGLEEVTVPQLYTGSGLEMFYDCDSLRRVTMDPKALFVPDGAFRDCDNLTSVTLSSNLNKVGQQAFYSCPKLTGVDFATATSLEVIGPLAFCRTALTTVSLPGSIEEIGLSAFGINRDLESIEVKNLQNPGGYFSDGETGVLYQVKGTSVKLIQYPAGRREKTFAVPEVPPSHNYTQGIGVTAIESYAFSHSEHLEKVTFPSTLRVIGYYAFSHCINLKVADVPGNVEQGEEIFEGSYHMTRVTLPPDIVKLTSSSFPINSKVTSVTLPDSVAEIDVISPFSSLSLLREIKVNDANPNFKSVDGVLFSKDGTILYAYPRGKAGSEYAVPEGVTTIWYGAFSDVTSLTHLIFPAGVTTVRPSACHNMSNLERLDILREMPAMSTSDKDPEVYNIFLPSARDQLQVYVQGNPTDTAGAASWVNDFVSTCGKGSSLSKQNVHVDFYKPVTQAGDRFLLDGVIYTLQDPVAKTVTVGNNAHYEGGSVLIPTQVFHQGTAYTVTAVAENAFPAGVQVVRREDLHTLTPGSTDLTYGEVLVLHVPSAVRDGTSLTLSAKGKALSAQVTGGQARFPVNKAMVDAFGFGTLTVSASAGSAAADFSLTLSPKTFTKNDLPWYNSSMQELVIEKPYDGTTVVDHTSAELLRNFVANGEKLALHITGNVPAPRSTTLHSVSNLKVEFVGETAGCYRVGGDVAANIRVQVTYGQLYLKEIDGVPQQPTFRRVWAAEDGMQLKDCKLSGGVFIAYLPTVESNRITGYTEVEVKGAITYDEVNHYPGLSSFEEMGVQQNQSYKWVFTPSGNGEYQTVLDNYRFFGTVKPWDPALTQATAGDMGKTGENPALPPYLLHAAGEKAPARPVGSGGAAAASPTSKPAHTPSAPSGSGGGSSGGSSGGGSKVPPTVPAPQPTASPVPTEPPAPAVPVTTRFADVEANNWYVDAVQYVCDKGLMEGMGEDSFAPDSTLTRGALVTILHRLEGTPACLGRSFRDVPGGQWYANGVVWAASQGLVNGFEDGSFRPEEPVTREQLVTILYRYTAGKEKATAARADLSGFMDAGQISPYAQDPLAWAKATGLVSGLDWGGIDPQGRATRAQIAAILQRFCETVMK